MRAVWQHGDDCIHVLHGVTGAGAYGRACGFHFIQGRLIDIEHKQLMASFNQIQRQGLAHDSQTDECDFHNEFLLTIKYSIESIGSTM